MVEILSYVCRKKRPDNNGWKPAVAMCRGLSRSAAIDARLLGVPRLARLNGLVWDCSLLKNKKPHTHTHTSPPEDNPQFPPNYTRQPSTRTPTTTRQQQAKMGALKYVEEIQKKKQSDILRFLLRVRCWELRSLNVIHRASRPSRPDKARRLGYKAKQGYVIYRIRVRRGGRKKPAPKGATYGKVFQCFPNSSREKGLQLLTLVLSTY